MLGWRSSSGPHVATEVSGDGLNWLRANLASLIYSSSGPRMRDHTYSSRRLIPDGRASKTFFSFTSRADVKVSSEGAGRRERTAGINDGCCVNNVVSTVSNAGFESEAAA